MGNWVKNGTMQGVIRTPSRIESQTYVISRTCITLFGCCQRQLVRIMLSHHKILVGTVQ